MNRKEKKNEKRRGDKKEQYNALQLISTVDVTKYRHTTIQNL